MDHVALTMPEHYLPVIVHYVVGEFITNEPKLSIRSITGDIISGNLVIINNQLCIIDHDGKHYVPLTSYRIMPS
jgi:hypothetical protein